MMRSIANHVNTMITKMDDVPHGYVIHLTVGSCCVRRKDSMNVEAIAKKFGLRLDEQIRASKQEEIDLMRFEREIEIYNRAIDDVIKKMEELKR